MNGMKPSSWVSEKEASDLLGVSEGTLSLWREIGYLKPGTHWRSSDEGKNKPWKPNVIYHIRWCKEAMEYWRDRDAHIVDKAA